MDKALIDCKRLLEKKRQYREGNDQLDRLQQFKMAGALRESFPSSAVAGMMVKHVTQLFTMISRYEEGEEIPEAKWKETIYDSINYHLLLLAALSEEKGE